MLITLPPSFVVPLTVHAACVALSQGHITSSDSGIRLYSTPRTALSSLTNVLDPIGNLQVLFHFESSSASAVQAHSLTLLEGTGEFVSVVIENFDVPCRDNRIALSHIDCYMDRGYNLGTIKALSDFCGQKDIPLFVYENLQHFIAGRTELSMPEGRLEAVQVNDASMFVSGDVARLVGWSFLAHRLFSRMRLMGDNTLIERAVLAELLRTRGVGSELDGLGQGISDSMKHADENPSVLDPIVQEARSASIAMMRLLSDSQSSAMRLPHDLYAALKQELGVRF